MSADPQHLYDAVAAELMGIAPITRGKMFGMPTLLHEGRAVAGYHHGAMVFKLGGVAHAEALALPGAHLFDPSGQGRSMREWVEVPPVHADRWPALAEAALAYAQEPREPR